MDALAALLAPEDDAPALDALLAPESFDPKAELKKREPWRFPKRPALARLTAEAEQLKSDHAFRIQVAATMNEWLNGERQGAFPRDVELLQTGEMTAAPITKLRDEHMKMVNWHARMDVFYKAYARDVIDREEREATEDGVRLFWEEIQEEFARQDGNGALRMALPDCAGRTGLLAAYIGPDPTNETTGLCFQMVDPFAVYPVWEGKRGLARVYLIYQADADHVIGHYGDPAGEVERKARRLATADAGEAEANAPQEKELIVCWDRAWTSVIWGGELLRQHQHDRGAVPFVIQYSGLGMQGFMHSPSPITGASDAELLAMGASMWGANTRQLDLARKAQPLLWRRVPAHALEEMLAVRLVSLVRRYTYKPPVIVKQGPASAAEGEPERDPQEDGTTLLRADDELQPYPALVDPGLMTATLTMLGQNSQSGVSPTVLNGDNLGGAQASGNAVDMLKADGNENWAPVTIMIEEFLGKVFRAALEIWRDEGEYLGDPDEPAGIVVPRTRRDALMGLTDPHILTPAMLARPGGCRGKVTLRKFNPMSLPPLTQSLMMARQAGLMSQELAIELIAAATDVEGELRRIETDQFDQVPEMLTARHLRLAHQRAINALRQGDLESARQEMLAAKYLADQQTIGMMQRLTMVGQTTMEAMQATQMMQMGGMGMGGPMMNPALGPGGGGMGGPDMGMGGANAGSMLSPSQFGGSTGQQGGRPPGPPPMPGMGG